MDTFFKHADLGRNEAVQIVSETLNKCDDGELYLENSKSELLVLDDNKIKTTSYNTSLGYGLRAVTGDVTAYSHSNEISKHSLKESSNNLFSTLKSKKRSNAGYGSIERFAKVWQRLKLTYHVQNLEQNELLDLFGKEFKQWVE